VQGDLDRSTVAGELSDRAGRDRPATVHHHHVIGKGLGVGHQGGW
jgi:hypothetical protein